MIRNILLFVIPFTLIISSCNLDYKHDKEIHYNNDYFPIQKGNVWEYYSNKYSKIICVKNAIQRDNYKYYLFEERKVYDGVTGPALSRLLRCNKQKNIEVIKYGHNKWFDSDKPQVIWYKFDANIGESWVSWDSSGNISVNGNKTHVYKITLLSKTDTVVTKDTTFTNCYKFFIDDVYSSDDEYIEWFAKDVGLVKRSSAYNFNSGILLRTYKVAK